ncbi:ATP-binding protein [Sorangium sp. So ce448]|uniref:HD domain-containing protein n=1 Tax=Sorangium sp. So ce448 TaxID=3133314 RepID=UPI003F63666F
MKIPNRLSRKLGRGELHGAVEQTLDRFEIWLKDNKLVFFEGYTDHGPDHVEAVMNSAEWLIVDHAWRVLTPPDAAVLVLGILLHDCAMHLSEDGFLRLINPSLDWAPCSPYILDKLQDRPWPELWTAFVQEASRFGEQKLVQVFDEPRLPDLRLLRDPREWTSRHRALIGEFLRRHHARLAHEIALVGVPGPTDRSSLVFAEMPPWLRDTAGFVARSHNMDLRRCVDLLPRERKKEFRGVHVPFLMAVLRVADYLQIDAQRAPETVLKIRSLRSPLSRSEWLKHLAVPHVAEHENDPEALSVDAEPSDVHTYLGLRRLFDDIQRELDQSWSVIGEVYGGHQTFSRLGLRVRRLRTSIDDVGDLAKRVDFVPVRTHFRTASGELLKLLVGPLYGHHPAYGVRELIQNSVDACRELADYAEQNGTLKDEVSKLEDKVDVIAVLEELEDGTGWFTISDRGIGMTPEVITEYFFTAGASFRNSDAWHRLHDRKDGSSRIFRTGRFGVGVLAAFLLGEEIEVTTRHVEAEYGVRFNCRVTDFEVELRYCECPVGTTIRIRVHEARVVETLIQEEKSWDWYCLDRPRVVRGIKAAHSHERERMPHLRPLTVGKITWLEQSECLSSAGEPTPPHWARLAKVSGYDDVQWSWLSGFPLYLNGFKVYSPHEDDIKPAMTGYLYDRVRGRSAMVPAGAASLKRPHLSVFDSAANFPVNVLRTEPAGWDQNLDDELVEPVCRSMLALLITFLPTSRRDAIVSLCKRSPERWNALNDLWRPFGSRSECPIAFAQHGVSLAEVEILTRLRANYLWFLAGGLPHKENAVPGRSLLQRLSEKDLVLVHFDAGGYLGTPVGHLSQWVRSALALDHVRDDDWEPPVTWFDSVSALRPSSRGVYRSVSSASQADVMDELSAAKEDVNYCQLNERWSAVWTGTGPHLDPHVAEVLSDARVTPAAVAVWVNDKAASVVPPLSCLGDAWVRHIRHPYIPYDLEERRSVLAHAYRGLEAEIRQWEYFLQTGIAVREVED